MWSVTHCHVCGIYIGNLWVKAIENLEINAFFQSKHTTVTVIWIVYSFINFEICFNCNRITSFLQSISSLHPDTWWPLSIICHVPPYSQVHSLVFFDYNCTYRHFIFMHVYKCIKETIFVEFVYMVSVITILLWTSNKGSQPWNRQNLFRRHWLPKVLCLEEVLREILSPPCL